MRNLIGQRWPRVRVQPVLMVVWVLALILLFGVVLLLSNGVPLEDSVVRVNVFLGRWVTPFYLGLFIVAFLTAVVVAVSPLGRVRLGEGWSSAEGLQQHSAGRPAFGFWTWLMMLFQAGMGSGLLFWGSAEPLWHALNPPQGAGVLDPAARVQQAFFITWFHWGVMPWAFYALFGVVLGLTFRHVARQPEGVSISQVMARWFPPATVRKGHHLGRRVSFLIDCVVVVGVVMGISATLGMATLQVDRFIGYFLTPDQVNHVPWRVVATMGVMTVGYLVSAWSGLTNGIRWLSWAVSGLMLALLVAVGVGVVPLSDLARVFSPAWWWGLVGAHVPLSLGLPWGISDAATTGASPMHLAWVGAWTGKYWSWWIAWTPFVAMFIVLISRGRSVRQVLLWGTLVPALLSMVWFGVFGLAGMALPNAQGILQGLDGTDRILIEVLRQLPWAGVREVLEGVALGVIVLGVVNSVDSVTLTLEHLAQGPSVVEDGSADELAVSAETTAEKRGAWGTVLGWGLLFPVIALPAVLAGGVSLLQEVTLLSVAPFAVILATLLGLFVAGVWRQWGRVKG